MSAPDFTPAEQKMISAMVRAGRNLPDNFCAIGVMQELACLCVKLQPLLSQDQMSILFGAGALISGRAMKEMTALVQAQCAIDRARRKAA